MSPRLTLRLQRLVLRTGSGPLRHVWDLVYRAATAVAARHLTKATPGATVFVGGALGTDDALPGLSDIDLLVVVASTPDRDAIAKTIATRYHALPGPLHRFLDQPIVLARDEVPDAISGNTLTWRRDQPEAAVYGWDPTRSDLPRLLERPEPAGSADRWRRVRGPLLELTPSRGASADVTLAAWLEIVFWWRLTFRAALGAYGPRGRHLCAKLIAEPARILLLAEHGEAYATKREALDRALVLYPDEEESLRLGRELLDTASDLVPFPLAETVPHFARLSMRVARLVGDRAGACGTTTASLRGDTSGLPLCDWRSLVFESALDERLEPVAWDPSDIPTLGRIAGAERGRTLTALRVDDLLVLPGATFPETRMRAVASRATDPVTFALIDGAAIATFPNHAGLSLDDISRRAVSERRAAITRPGHEPTIAELFLAARAATLRVSLAEGNPVIPLTAGAIADELADRRPRDRDLVGQAYAELTGVSRESTRTALVTVVRGLLEQR